MTILFPSHSQNIKVIYLLFSLSSQSRLQVQGGKEKYKDMGTAFRMIVKEEGLSALYKGAIPRMVVVGPLFGITLLAFEAQKAYMIKNGLL